MLGLAAWGLRETPLETQLTMTAGFGLELLELGIGGYRTDRLQPDAGPEAIDAVRRLFAEAGLKPDCAATGNDFDGNGMAASLAATRRVIDIAGALGVRYLRIFGGFTPLAELAPEARRAELRALAECAVRARERGIVPALETHGAVAAFADGVRHCAGSSTDPETVAATLAAVPELALNFDPANLWAVGVDPMAFFRRFRDRIVYVHLKDFVQLPSGAIRGGACGDGALPWPELKHALAGFPGPMLIEYEQPADVQAGFARSLEFWQK